MYTSIPLFQNNRQPVTYMPCSAFILIYFENTVTVTKPRGDLMNSLRTARASAQSSSKILICVRPSLVQAYGFPAPGADIPFKALGEQSKRLIARRRTVILHSPKAAASAQAFAAGAGVARIDVVAAQALDTYDPARNLDRVRFVHQSCTICIVIAPVDTLLELVKMIMPAGAPKDIPPNPEVGHMMICDLHGTLAWYI